MPLKKVYKEVLFDRGSIVKLKKKKILSLRNMAIRNSSHRMRLCVHSRISDKVHEMFIFHGNRTYVRPHRHLNKTESFHIVEGRLDVIIFDNDGKVADVIKMSSYAKGGVFFYRLNLPLYHTVIIRSALAVFHEATCGPFRKKDAKFASWSPVGIDDIANQRFMGDLKKKVTAFLKNKEV